jgi:predicted XRE-type DNA-binding protein
LTSADDGEAVKRLLPQQKLSQAEAYEALKAKMPEHARIREISLDVPRAKTIFEIT